MIRLNEPRRSRERVCSAGFSPFSAHRMQRAEARTTNSFVRRAVEIGPSDRNPKHQRGNDLGPSLTLRVTILPSRGAMFLAIVALASIGWAMEGGPTPADGLLQDTPAAGAAQAVAAPDELLLGSGPPDRQAVEQLKQRAIVATCRVQFVFHDIRSVAGRPF